MYRPCPFDPIARRQPEDTCSFLGVGVDRRDDRSDEDKVAKHVLVLKVVGLGDLGEVVVQGINPGNSSDRGDLGCSVHVWDKSTTKLQSSTVR